MVNNKINIESLDEFIGYKFSNLFPDLMYEGYGDCESNKLDILYELENYGIKSILDLEVIIPDDYLEVIKSKQMKFNYLGTVRLLLIINDHSKYIDNYNKFNYRNFWGIENIKSAEPLFSHYNISVDKIINLTKE